MLSKRSVLLGLAIAWTLGGTSETTLGQEGTTVKTAKLPQVLCPVSNEPASLAISLPTDDGPVFLCGKDCGKKFQEDPAKYVEKIAKQRKALGSRPKVQVSCPISGNPIDRKVYAPIDGQKVYFCCSGCIAKYQAEPAKYKKALANAYTYQTRCPVMGEPIDPTAFATLPTGEKVYYCCMGCDSKLRAEPDKFAPKLAAQGVLIDVQKLKKAAGS